jgi:hypothetical protein
MSIARGVKRWEWQMAVVSLPGSWYKMAGSCEWYLYSFVCVTATKADGFCFNLWLCYDMGRTFVCQRR